MFSRGPRSLRTSAQGGGAGIRGGCLGRFPALGNCDSDSGSGAAAQQSTPLLHDGTPATHGGVQQRGPSLPCRTPMPRSQTLGGYRLSHPSSPPRTLPHASPRPAFERPRSGHDEENSRGCDLGESGEASCFCDILCLGLCACLCLCLCVMVVRCFAALLKGISLDKTATTQAMPPTPPRDVVHAFRRAPRGVPLPTAASHTTFMLRSATSSADIVPQL